MINRFKSWDLAMEKITFETEADLIRKFKETTWYKDFREKDLQPKIDREKEARKLLSQNRGQYTKEILNNIFDTIAPGRWFGQLLGQPNRNLIFQSSTEDINKWIDTCKHLPYVLRFHCNNYRAAGLDSAVYVSLYHDIVLFFKLMSF